MSALQRIKIWDLRLGMIIVRCDRAGVPFNEYGVPLTNLVHAQNLAAYGVENVYVWIGDTPPDGSSNSAQELNPPVVNRISKEDDIPSIALAAASELSERSLKTVSKAMSDIKKGTIADIDALNMVISDIVHMASDSPGIFTSLTPIKSSEQLEYSHGLNVCLLSVSIAQAMGVKGREIIDLGIASLLHDIGKMRVPEKILSKRDMLNEMEFTVLKKHPAWGQEILAKNNKINNEVLLAVMQHHECCDGSGYPSALAGRYLSRNAKVLAVSEAYSTMINGGVECYQSSHNTEAVKRIYAGMSKQYSDDVVKAFVTVVGIYPVGTVVRLTDNSMGVVCEVNKKDQSKPKVILVGKDGKGNRTFLNLASRNDLKVSAPVGHTEFGIEPNDIFYEFLQERIKAQINSNNY